MSTGSESLPSQGVPRYELINHVRQELFSTELGHRRSRRSSVALENEVCSKVVILRRKVTENAWLRTLVRERFFSGCSGSGYAALSQPHRSASRQHYSDYRASQQHFAAPAARPELRCFSRQR